MIYHIKTKKKELFLLIFLLSLIVLYSLAMFLLASNNILNYWFVVGLFLISIYVLSKSIVFRSDSSLYLSILCFMISIFGTLANIYYFNLFTLISFLLLSFSISHLLLFLFFHKISNFWTFVFFFLLFLPVILYSFYCINLLIMLLFICGDIVTFTALFIIGRYE